MNFFSSSLLILSICIILGQSKPAQYKPHALPKKCIDAHKHNLGPQEGRPVQGGSFRSAKKSREQSKLPPSARLSALSSAPPVAEELSPGSGPPPFNEGIDYKDPPSPKTEDDYLEDDFLEDAEYKPDDTDDDQEFPEEDNSDPEVLEEDNSVPEVDNSDPEVPDEEGDPKAEEPEIQGNGNNCFLSTRVP